MTLKSTWRPAAAALTILLCTAAWADDRDDAKHAGQLMRAFTIIGMDVNNPSGEQLGEIQDLAIDTRAGHCRFAVVSYGGALGVGDTLVAVPFKALKFTDAEGPVHLDITTQRLEQAPKFTDDRWDAAGDDRWSTTVYEYYSIKPDFDVKKTTVTVTSPLPKFVKASKAVGMDARNPKDEDLGEVEDLMIDTRSGKIAYAVLSFGGVLGINVKLFAVTWKALTLDDQKERFVLNVDKNKLKAAPGFDKNSWPNMADVRWSKDVHAYYGSEPNWIYGYSGEGANAARKSGGWGLNDEYQRLFNDDSMQTIKGTVAEMGHVTPMSGMEDGRQVTVQTNEGAMIVHLGPGWFIDRQDRALNKGEAVEVKGSRVQLDGKPVMIATEIKCGDDILRLRDKDGQPMWIAWHMED